MPTPLKPRPAPHGARTLGALALLCLALSGCGKPMAVHDFAGTQPVFDPLKFWAGHHRSWGVLEDSGGAPEETVVTDCVGAPQPDGTLRMTQTLTMGDGTVQHRNWRLWREASGHYAATANDMVGEAQGEAAGRVFHWAWVLALSPGNPLKNVTMDQWMYLYPGGTMMNRTTVRKLGLVVAQVSERFEAVP